MREAAHVTEHTFKLKCRRESNGDSDRADRMALEVLAGSSLGKVAKRYGVSRVAVFKVCKLRGIKSRHKLVGSP